MPLQWFETCIVKMVLPHQHGAHFCLSQNMLLMPHQEHISFLTVERFYPGIMSLRLAFLQAGLLAGLGWLGCAGWARVACNLAGLLALDRIFVLTVEK